MHVCMDTMNRFSFQISQIFCSRLTNQFKPNLIKCQISARFRSLFQRMSCLDTIRGHWSRWSTLIIKWFPLTAGEITSHFKIKPLITFLIWSFSCILCACERSRRLSSTPICASWDSLVTKVFFCHAMNAIKFLQRFKTVQWFSFCTLNYYYYYYSTTTIVFLRESFIPKWDIRLFNHRHEIIYSCQHLQDAINLVQSGIISFWYETFAFAFVAHMGRKCLNKCLLNWEASHFWLFSLKGLADK